MSIIKEKLREYADFISLSETLELLMRHGEGCTLADAAKYLLRFDFLDPFFDFLPEFVYCDRVYGFVGKLAPDVCDCLKSDLECIARGHSYAIVRMDFDDYGFERSKLIPVFEKHEISASNCAERIYQPASDDKRERLHQLEAENVRLVEQVAELQRQLQEAAAAPQDDDEKPLHPKRETTYLNTIGALVELIQSPRPDRNSDAAVIRELVDNYGDRPGIGERTLEKIFPMARERLKSY